MFSRSRSGRGRHNFGRNKKESNSKRHHIRTWVVLNKKRNHDGRGIMMSGDSPPPLRMSIPSSGFDIPEDTRPGKTTPTSPKTPLVTSDPEVIEEAVPIMEKTLPLPEPKPKIERNGPSSDAVDGKKFADDGDDDTCVKCVYFAQQCCECTIL